MRLETGRKRAFARRERLCIRFVGEKLDALILQERCFCGQLPGLLVGGGEFARLNLAGLDVGLIEGIDAED